jgi:hypothetical protein
MKKIVDSFIILGKVRTIKHLSIYYPLKDKMQQGPKDSQDFSEEIQ